MKGPYAVLLQSTNDPHEFLVGYDGLQSLDEARAKRDDPELPDCEKVVVHVPDEDADAMLAELAKEE